MAYRSKTLVARLSLCGSLLFATSLWAAEIQLSPEGAAALEKGLDLQQQAKVLRDTADKKLEEDELVCAEKFLVNDCRNAAKASHLEQVRKARSMEAEGRGLERKARLEERNLKQKKLEADAAKNQVDLREREKAHAQEIQTLEAQRQRKLEQKAADIKDGGEKAAARRQRQEEKRAQHLQAVQEKLDKVDKKPAAEAAPQVTEGTSPAPAGQ